MDGTGFLICAAKFLFLNLSRVWVLSCFLRVLCISAEKAFWGAPRSSKERANCNGQHMSLYDRIPGNQLSYRISFSCCSCDLPLKVHFRSSVWKTIFTPAGLIH